MKQRTSLLIVLSILSISLMTASCEMVASDTPDCILIKIDQLKNTSTESFTAQIQEYSYQGFLVYYIPPLGPDQFGELYDINCNLICYPDGGISGNGDGNCSDFFSEASFVRLIWKD